ncbi:MAG: HAMP domain-containing protein, partial [Sneathiella sp.]|nr:HAMP domain-containing protein [Sneathiella sp.]
MKVKTKLFSGAGLTAIVTAIFVLLVYHFSTSIQQKLANAELVSQLVKSTTEFSFLSEQYISYGLERIEQQWDVKRFEVDTLMKNIEKSPVLGRIEAEIYAINQSFRKLKSLKKKEDELQLVGMVVKPTEQLNIEKGRAVTRLRLHYTRISALAFQLSKYFNENIKAIQKQSNILVSVFAAGLVLVLIYVTFFITRDITKKLGQLSLSVDTISHGNLDVVVPDLGRDELGDLALAFDDMRLKRRDAEESLRVNEANLKRAQTVAHVGSWLYDFKENTLTWSDEAYRIFDIPKGTPLSYQDFLETVVKEDREFVERNWKNSIHNESYNIEHRILINGAIKWVNEKAKLEFSETGEPLRSVGTVQDITERKSLEEQVSRTQKLDAVGHLTGGICHDFNNILGIVLGNLEILQENLIGDEKNLARVESAIKASDRGSDLTKKLLSFSRKSSQVTKLVCANDHIENLE